MILSKTLGLLVFSAVAFSIATTSFAIEPNAPSTKALKTTRDSKMGDKHRVKSSVTISPSLGKINLHTKTWTKNLLLGYRSGMYFILLDGKGNVLYKSPEVTSGVNAKWVPGASSRTKTREYKVSSSTLKKARKVVIRHYEAGKFAPGKDVLLGK